jgi:hypothetical protein
MANRRSGIETRSLAGRAAKAETWTVDPDWIGWSGQLAHPLSPQGGGGPGGFAPNLLARNDSRRSPSPWQPGPLGTTVAPAGPSPQSANPAPATTPRSLGVLQSAQSDLLDVSVAAEILADTSGRPKAGSSAETSFSLPAYSFPGATLDKHRKIGHFNGKFTWKGTISVQTVFGPGAHANDLSCYGRGTTEADVRARDITLGFHESCHRSDYEAYLKANPLPAPPKLTVGMSESDYKAAEVNFKKAFDTYSKEMSDQSMRQTDEVGNKLSAVKRTHKCFKHVVP